MHGPIRLKRAAQFLVLATALSCLTALVVHGVLAVREAAEKVH
jgi:hypothetical protein